MTGLWIAQKCGEEVQHRFAALKLAPDTRGSTVCGQAVTFGSWGVYERAKPVHPCRDCFAKGALRRAAVP